MLPLAKSLEVRLDPAAIMAQAGMNPDPWQKGSQVWDLPA